MSKIWNRVAWTVLASVFIGMSIYLLLNPTRTGVVPNYRLAVENWWASRPIYGTSTHGFLYFPQFILFFSPFEWFRPAILGEILWRLLGFGLFAAALGRLAKLISPSNGGVFLALVLLAVPASLAALSNGQTNLPLSAGIVLATLAIRDQRWDWAAGWLTFLVVLKPIALAPWLLAVVVFPSLRRPLFLGVIPLVLAGFLHPDLSYAWDRWQACVAKILHAYTPENLRVSDLFGALGKTGIVLPPVLEKGVRATACLGALAYVWRSFLAQGLAGAAWALWVATALVFTVFNPRAETNSYVLISPLLAYAAVSYWREVEGGKWKGVVLSAACIGLMCDGMGLWIYQATDVWFKPLIVLLVSPLLFRVPEGWRQIRGP